MRVAILGAGAMGSWFGGRLAEAGIDVQLLTTNTAHREAIDRYGLTLETSAGRSNVVVPVYAPENVEGPVDLFILLTKCFQSRAAMDSVAHAIGESTYVLSLQNGLGNSDVLAEFLPETRILIGITMMPVDKVAPGVVKKTGDGITRFNSFNNIESPVTSKLLNALAITDINLVQDDNIHQVVWEKVAFNAGMNAVCALGRATPGNIAAAEGAMDLVKRVATEVAIVARAQGITIDIDTVFGTIEYACANHKMHQPSMVQDLIAGKRTEVDALNGAVARLAEKHGMEAPLNQLLLTLVKVAEDSAVKCK